MSLCSVLEKRKRRQQNTHIQQQQHQDESEKMRRSDRQFAASVQSSEKMPSSYIRITQVQKVCEVNDPDKIAAMWNLNKWNVIIKNLSS